MQKLTAIEQDGKTGTTGRHGIGILAGCFLIALLLCFAQISGSRVIIAACLVCFLAFHFFACFTDAAFCVLLFFLPWSPLLRLDRSSISFFTLALLLTCLLYFQKNGFVFELYQILTTASLASVTLIAKGIQSNPISNSYLFFFAMLLLFPCVAKGICRTVSFSRLTLFFACGIILAALSAEKAAMYPNISQYIKVDSYLTITRLSGFYRDPNFYSAHITACLAGVLAIISHERQRSRLLIWVALFIALVYCGMLSASKSFVVVLACLLLVWVPIILKKGNISGKLALLLGLLCSVGVFFASSAVRELLRIVEVRFSYASDVSELTTGRTDLWMLYLREFVAEPLLTLFGEGYTGITLNEGASHNTVIQGVYQFGVLGFPILCIWLAFMLKRAAGGMLLNFRADISLLMCTGVVLPWMALDILFFDEFFLLPVYALVGIAYWLSGTETVRESSPNGRAVGHLRLRRRNIL